MTGSLSDTEIAARIRAASRCALPFCREQRDRAGALCPEHRDELARILDPAYSGERDLDRAASIAQLYARLDPTPGRSGDQDRRPAGFRSSPPCDLTPVVMRDHRSASGPVVPVWYEPRAGGVGDDHARPHYEDTNPPRPVLATLAGVVVRLGAHPGPEAGDATTLCAWLHEHLDDLAAHPDAAGLFTELAELHRQLRPVAGDPPARPVASCTGWVRDPITREKIECSAPLYLPPPQPGVDTGPARPPKVDPTKPVMRCRRCDRPYTHLQLVRLEIGAQRAG